MPEFFVFVRYAVLATVFALITACFKEDEGNRAPEITGKAVTEVTLGRAYSFAPRASDPDGDVLSFEITNKPAWATFDTTRGKLSGRPEAADVGIYENIMIRVSDGQASKQLGPFSIAVNVTSDGSATLSWDPPTQHEDGRTLSTLAGYRVIYGTSADDLTESDQLRNPGLARYTVTNLSAATWHFAIVAYTTTGVESRLSTMVSTTID
jgi:hypothetical protein